MDKKKFIKELLPDLLNLIDAAIDKIEKPDTVKKKPGRPRKTQETKKPAPKPKAKKPTTAKVKKEPKKIPPREDFMGENTFVDDLSVASEFIETDKIICKKNKTRTNTTPTSVMKTCGLTVDESGNQVQISGCGRKFESFGGYLCDSCLTSRKNNA